MTDSTGVDGALYFLPLGGTDEIGMNFYLYGIDDYWMIVDLGITFGDETTPGVDIIVPDPVFIEERREDLVGIVLTHGHEDHFGAIQYLWPRLRCPIYCTPFTAAFLRLKLADTDFGHKVQIIEIPVGGEAQVGPFDVRFVHMTHSIPEPNALIIRTRLGTLVHSGDWKLDPDPLMGELSDIDSLRAVGSEGVLALIGDSTNALEPGHSGSESQVRERLAAVIRDQPYRVVVTCFSTNVARLHSIAEAARASGRQCALVGRSLWRIHEAARLSGYLQVAEPFLTEDEAARLPRDKVVMACTGSQGESRSALTRISHDDHPRISLEPRDTVIFSAREIPGNEKAIGRVQNALARRGITVITPHQEPDIHVSGHPAREELVTMYQWLRPRIAIPMHGEPKHLRAHAELARACQVPEVLVPQDGGMIRLAPGPAEQVGIVPVGRMARDGHRFIELDGSALRGRSRMVHNGAAVVTLVIDRQGRLYADPQVSLLGLEDAADLEDVQDAVADEVRAAVESLSKSLRTDDDKLREAARISMRRAFRSWHGKRPVTEVHLVRL
jgi:ribonuclease J